jgi:glucokinase
MTEPWRLIADIGGTNARFACANASGRIENVWVRPVSEYQTFAAVLDAYLETLAANESITSAAIAGAGPATNGLIELTNSTWRISTRDVATRLQRHAEIRILNDLEAVAHAVPFLSEQQVVFSDLQPGPIATRNRMLVVNVGTGFGASSLVRAGGHWLSCPSEAGHMLLGATSRQELELFERLGEAACTTEDIMSGNGVQRLAAAVQAERTGLLPGADGVIENFDLGNGSDLASEVVRTLTGLMARACSNLVLASAAWDGLYICGSVAAAWWQHADLSEFRSRFVGRSKMHGKLEATPVGLITAQHPAFIGLANLRV